MKLFGKKQSVKTVQTEEPKQALAPEPEPVQQPDENQLRFARKITMDKSVKELEEKLRTLERKGLEKKPMHQAILIILKEKRGH